MSTQRGQISLLIIGFAVILLSLVAVVVDASQVMLLRRSLSSLADGAALSAAQSVAEDALYSGAGDYLPLDERRARAEVQRYLRASPIPVQVLQVDVQGDRVTVWLSAQARLPLVGVVTEGFAETTVTARASARSPIA
jgi:Flp pilus assembly protein TadG